MTDSEIYMDVIRDVCGRYGCIVRATVEREGETVEIITKRLSDGRVWSIGVNPAVIADAGQLIRHIVDLEDAIRLRAGLPRLK